MPSARSLRSVVRCVAVAALAVAASVPAAQAQKSSKQSPDADLDAYIVKGMQDWKIPGLSIAVVKNDSVVYAKGFGVRKLGAPDSVNAQTLFGMMSTTKAMTALAVAMLVDSGKVAWGDPVTKYLPWFQLSDPYVTQQLTVRDLLRHNAGLGNADLLWVRGDIATRDILERVRKLPMAYSLRDGFVYQNVMYQVAGEVVAAASGMPWDRFVKTRIMDPIGMTRSQATLTAMQATHDANVSSAHFEIDGTTRPIAEAPVDAVPAAGAAWSSAEETGKWVRFLLDSGRVNGKRLVSEANFKELMKPQSFVTASEFYPTASITKPHWMTYGLGWFQQDYRGKFIAMHTGSIDGRTAIVALVPEERVGVYIFGNTDHAEFRHALMWRVIDRYTGAPARDWSAEFLKLYGDRKASGEKARTTQEAKRVMGTKPSLAIAAYAGTYDHPVYGDILVTLEGDALVAKFGPMPTNTGRLEHWNYDTFRARLGDGRDGWTYFQFRLKADGTVAAVRFQDESSLEFTRRK